MGDPTFLSLFSGIGGFDLGLERAGWHCVGQVESDAYRRGVLGRWWSGIPTAKDVRTFDAAAWPALWGEGRRTMGGVRNGSPSDTSLSGPAGVDLICGGFPCQDLSVAGRRAGLQGERSSLFFEFARIADALRPRWLLVENVPGLLSSHRGRDFAVVLSTLADLGYGVAWRVLDSRYFGVPQRRRRVFVVGCLRARSPEPFLPFLEGGEGDPAEGRTEGKDVAGTLGGGSGKRGWCDDLDRSGAFVTGPLGGGNDGIGRRSEDDPNLVAYALRSDPGGTGQGHNTNYAYTLGQNERNRSQGPANYVATPAVRRLTPVECCRLQGFPDDWLGGNEPPDSPKYAALGDAVTVPVAEWIGRRLLMAASGGSAT